MTGDPLVNSIFWIMWYSSVCIDGADGIISYTSPYLLEHLTLETLSQRSIEVWLTITGGLYRFVYVHIIKPAFSTDESDPERYKTFGTGYYAPANNTRNVQASVSAAPPCPPFTFLNLHTELLLSSPLEYHCQRYPETEP